MGSDMVMLDGQYRRLLAIRLVMNKGCWESIWNPWIIYEAMKPRLNSVYSAALIEQWLDGLAFRMFVTVARRNIDWLTLKDGFIVRTLKTFSMWYLCYWFRALLWLHKAWIHPMATPMVEEMLNKGIHPYGLAFLVLNHVGLSTRWLQIL